MCTSENLSLGSSLAETSKTRPQSGTKRRLNIRGRRRVGRREDRMRLFFFFLSCLPGSHDRALSPRSTRNRDRAFGECRWLLFSRSLSLSLSPISSPESRADEQTSQRAETKPSPRSWLQKKKKKGGIFKAPSPSPDRGPATSNHYHWNRPSRPACVPTALGAPSPSLLAIRSLGPR